MNENLASRTPRTHGSSDTARWAVLAPLGSIMLLAGCAGAKVGNVSMTAPVAGSVAPATLRVEVAVAPELGTDASETATRLSSDLVSQYRRQGIPAVAGDAQIDDANMATLHVQISRADPGNRLARVVIGLGAGKSVLRTDTSFNVGHDGGPALTLTTSADSGRRPGLILPGGIAAATGNAAHFAIGGGLELLTGTARSGLSSEAQRSAKLIVKQTKALYLAEGWTWPSKTART